MNKILILPDIHGRTFWKQLLSLDLSNYNKIIFLGDYTDSYQHEGITHLMTLENLKELINFKQEYLNKVILLYGNHDFGYLNRNYLSCRYSDKLWSKFNKLFTDNKELFHGVVYEFIQNEQKYICSHAGINENWLKINNLTISDVNNLNELFINNPNIFNQISYYRGGNYSNGSPLWADLREFIKNHDDIHLANYEQIIGHTQLEENAIHFNNIHNLDCRKIFILENNKIIEL